MERQFFSGNTLDQAVLAAARHYELAPERVAYKLRDKKHGFLNARRKVVIEVDPTAPELSNEARLDNAPHESKEDQGHVETPIASSEPRRQEDRERFGNATEEGDDDRSRAIWRGEENSWASGNQADPEVGALEEAIRELSDLVGMKLTPSIWREEGGFDIDLAGPDSGLLRKERGSGLSAMEHLLPRLVRGLSGRGVPCRVDSEGFRATHEEALRVLAENAAEDVRHEREEKRLEPMNPTDRRSVHLALADDPTVRTVSEGEGFLKRVRIVPV